MLLRVSNVKMRFIHTSKSIFLFIPFRYSDLNYTDYFHWSFLLIFFQPFETTPLLELLAKGQRVPCEGGQLAVLSEVEDVGMCDINLDVYVISIKQHCVEIRYICAIGFDGNGKW